MVLHLESRGQEDGTFVRALDEESFIQQCATRDVDLAEVRTEADQQTGTREEQEIERRNEQLRDIHSAGGCTTPSVRQQASSQCVSSV